MRIRVAAAILIDLRGHTLLVDRGQAGNASRATGDLAALFSNLWQFPAVIVRRASRAELRAHLRRILEASNGRRFHLKPLRTARHAVTYREITLIPYLARVGRLPGLGGSKRVPLADLARLAVSNATRKLATAASEALQLR